MLDSIVGYHVDNHQVHIHYYKPRGDQKEAWDNIDIVGFAGIAMQMKINFLCSDSGLAAPLVVDLVRLLDVAKRTGEAGIQRQLSLFFKSPYHAGRRDPGARPLQAGAAPPPVGAREERPSSRPAPRLTRRRRRTESTRWRRGASDKRGGLSKAGRSPSSAAPPRSRSAIISSGRFIGEDERRAVARVLDRNVLSGATAPECVGLERELATYAGVKYALLTHSGTSALHLALAAAGIAAGDHVLVPAYSFVATPLSVLHCGAIPIFVDVDEATGLMDPVATAAAITPRTRAIMPVHVHGCAADLGPFLELAEKHRVALIEDAAQAHGATWQGKPVGSIGRAAGFSFQSSKNLGIGEGGAVLTNDEALAEEANRLRNFGQDVHLAERDSFDAERPLDGTRALQSGRIGSMFRGNELAAAIARTSLAKLRRGRRFARRTQNV